MAFAQEARGLPPSHEYRDAVLFVAEHGNVSSGKHMLSGTVDFMSFLGVRSAQQLLAIPAADLVARYRQFRGTGTPCNRRMIGAIGCATGCRLLSERKPLSRHVQEMPDTHEYKPVMRRIADGCGPRYGRHAFADLLAFLQGCGLRSVNDIEALGRPGLCRAFAVFANRHPGRRRKELALALDIVCTAVGLQRYSTLRGLGAVSLAPLGRGGGVRAEDIGCLAETWSDPVSAAAFLAMLDLVGGAERRWPLWLAKQICHVTQDLQLRAPLQDNAAFVEADAHQLRDWLSACPAYVSRSTGHQRSIVSFFVNAKMHPIVDRGGEFRAFLHAVPRSTMQSDERFWKTNMAWVRKVTLVDDPTDRRLWIAIGDRVVDVALSGKGRKLRDRVVASVLTQTASTLRLARRAHPGRGYAEILTAVQSPEDALTLLARMVGATNHALQQSGRRRYSRLADGRSPRCQKIITDFQLLVRSGVFVSQGVPETAAFTGRAVRRRLLGLTTGGPVGLTAVEPDYEVYTEVLEDGDVEAMYLACRCHREASILALLAESGFRAGAIGQIRLRDVWDATQGEVLRVISVREKGSKVRRNIPNDTLREHLHAYITRERNARAAAGSEWLYPHRVLAHKPALRCAKRCVDTLCRRTSNTNARLSPHPFPGTP